MTTKEELITAAKLLENNGYVLMPKEPTGKIREALKALNDVEETFSVMVNEGMVIKDGVPWDDVDTIRTELIKSADPVTCNGVSNAGVSDALNAYDALYSVFQTHIEETLDEEMPDDDETVFLIKDCDREIRSALQDREYEQVDLEENKKLNADLSKQLIRYQNIEESLTLAIESGNPETVWDTVENIVNNME